MGVQPADDRQEVGFRRGDVLGGAPLPVPSSLGRRGGGVVASAFFVARGVAVVSVVFVINQPGDEEAYDCCSLGVAMRIRKTDDSNNAFMTM